MNDYSLTKRVNEDLHDISSTIFPDAKITIGLKKKTPRNSDVKSSLGQSDWHNDFEKLEDMKV